MNLNKNIARSFKDLTLTLPRKADTNLYQVSKNFVTRFCKYLKKYLQDHVKILSKTYIQLI